MKILLLGSTGQVGWELNRTLLTLGDITALDYPQIDMANPPSIQTAIQETKPDLIINATAYTNVEKAELEPDLAQIVNGVGPGILAEEAKKIGAAFIHYSTDFVFDGTKGSPYTEDDLPNPINVYGKTKLAGDKAVQAAEIPAIIFRTSWVYSNRRPCFVSKVLNWASKGKELHIVDDQISTPTWARMVAEATAQVIIQSKNNPVDYFMENRGVYNLTCSGYCSRFEWAEVIIQSFKNLKEYENIKILPAKTVDFPSTVERPAFSALNLQKITNLNIAPPDWKSTLMLCLSGQE